MKNARIIAVLVLLALSLSGCANVDRSEVSAPSSQETVMAEPAQSTVPQEQATVSVSGSTEVPAEITAEPEPVETKPEVSTPAKEESAADRQQPYRNYPAESIRTRTTGQNQWQHSHRSLNSPAEEEPTEPAFDIQTWIDYAKAYAESIGLRMESSAVDCWDNPISVGTHCSYLERDIQSRLNRYARDEDITDVWIWAEARSDGKYDLYIGYA